MHEAPWTAPENDVTRLDRPLRREIEIDSKPYTLTLYPHTLKLARKGQRRSIEFSWEALLRLGAHSELSRPPRVVQHG